MIPIIFHPAAETEMNAAHDFLEHRILGLGDKFLNDIENSIKIIQNSPERWQLVEGNIHKYGLKRFPFNIYYEILTNYIQILAIAHHKRNPNY